MKKSILLIAMITTTTYFTNSIHAQWNESISTVGGSEVDFPNENAAYALGGNGLYKSTDAGISWNEIYDFDCFCNPNDLNFINRDTGFINVYYNGYMRTTDGGFTWNDCSVPFGFFLKVKITQNILFSSYTNNDTTFIIKSTDFGDSWVTIFQNYQVGTQPFILSFVDTLNAYFINPNELDRVYKTTNGFLSIDTIFIINGDLVLQEEFDFKDLQNGYLYGGWGASSHPTRTWNTGTLYFSIDLDGFEVLPVLDLDFNTTKLYASSLYGKIFYSTNNGGSWTEQITPITGPIYSISFLNNDKGIAISDNKVLYTNNGGMTGIETPVELLTGIYPNPASDIVNIPIELQSVINVLDINGKIVLSKIISPGEPLSLVHLSNGIYCIKVKNEKGISAGRIIVNHND